MVVERRIMIIYMIYRDSLLIYGSLVWASSGALRFNRPTSLYANHGHQEPCSSFTILRVYSQVAENIEQTRYRPLAKIAAMKFVWRM
jgi:hypothetical protein